MAKQVEKCVFTELIDGNGNFNTDKMEKFKKDAKLAERGRSYGVVSIMGPQSSGKSTLLNQLFRTDFKEMDARLGRFQTTKGICLAQSPLTERCLLVLDTEGSDGAERKDNTTFERQSALFAIAVSEIVMINMWHHDFGRRNAASWPLMTVVFEVMLRILRPSKVHLIFVLRDSIETPLEILKMQLMNQLEEIWNELPKTPAQTNTGLRDLFEIEVVALSHYRYQKEEFDKEVATLRERVVCSLASSELTANRIDASAFTLNTQMIWDQIKKNKDLDLPSQKVMVAEIRCDEIFQEKYQNFVNDSTWIKVKNDVDSGAVVQGFGMTVSRLINTCLSEYDKDALYFDEGVRAAKSKLLTEKMLQVIEPTYRSLLDCIRVAAMENFRKAITDGLHKKKLLEEIAQYQTKYLLNQTHDLFEDAAIKQADWNHATTEYERLRQEMGAYVDHTRQIIEKNEDGALFESLGVKAMPLPTALSSFSRIKSTLMKIKDEFHSDFSIDLEEEFRVSILRLSQDWSILTILLESIHMLSNADAYSVQAGGELLALAHNIDAAAVEIAEIADHIEEEKKQIAIKNQQYSMSEIIRQIISSCETKNGRLMAEIGEALDLYLSSSGSICCSWSFPAASPSRPHVSLLLSLARSAGKHLDDMPILPSMGIEKDMLDAELLIVSNYITDLDFSSLGSGDDDDESCGGTVDVFLSHFASVLVNFAIQSCNYWIHCKSTTTTDSLTPIRLLKNSHNQIDPTNPKFMEFHVNLLIALNKIPGYRVEFVNFFCSYLIGDRSYAHRSEVSSLIISFLDSSKTEEEDVVQSFGQEITAVLLEMATLFEPERINRGKERRKSVITDGVPASESSELLTKICLVKAELCLREQIRKISSSSNSNCFSSYHVISNCRLKIENQFDHILNKLREYSKDVPQEKLEYGKKTLDLVEQIHKESSSLFSLFQLKQMAEEYKLKNSLLLLLLRIVLFKAEPFLMELSLLNKSSSSSGAAATVMDYGGKDRIAILLQLLEYFKQILSDQKLKDREDVYMSFVQIEICARGMACFSYSFHPSKITEEVIRKMFISACEVLDKLKHLDSKANKIGTQFPLSKSPKTYKLGFIDFLVRNLVELLKYDPPSIAPVRHHIEEVQLHLKSLTSSLGRVSESDIDRYPELKDLNDHVTDIAYKVEYLIDSIEIDTQWYYFFWFYHLSDELRIVNKEASRIHLTTSTIAKTQNIKKVIPIAPDVLVDLHDEEQFIIDQLTRGYSRRSVVSIVGMSGIGKTTMARKVYNSEIVLYHFHRQAWCHVSQVYDKRKLLLEILSNIVRLNDEIYKMSNEDLESKLRRCLLKNKYLIVMDDIWDIGAWNDLQNSFPDDGNGSRILITTQLEKLALEIEPDVKPRPLRPFSDDESWEFLERKVFQGDGCPPELVLVGKEIARKCKGLALAVVAISGLLQVIEKSITSWTKIAENLSAKLMEDPQTQCLNILELSYKHLPGYLKACFLYLGVFLEDRDIPVSKLIRFWLAEGFIEDTESEIFEDVAEAYLADLISRSLIMIAKTGSNGKVKACRLHDLIRDLCRSKAKDENFLQLVTRDDKPYASFPNSDYGFELDFYNHSSPIAFEAYRLSMFLKRNHFVESRPSGQGTRSLIFLACTDSEPRCPYDVSFICHNFKLLRVLDIECINLGVTFPVEIGEIVRLRYLSVGGYMRSVPETIANLRELETLIVKGLRGKVVLPERIWHMTSLRHLHVNIHLTFHLGDEKLGGFFQLNHLVSLSRPSFSCGEDTEKIMKRLPNLRKLSCIFFESQGSSKNCNQFPKLSFLTQLESLKIFYYGSALNTGEFNFPLKLTELSLSNFWLTRKNISAIGRLPNLAVLKLLSGAFEGHRWDMREEEFLELKFLKLDNLNISPWNASCDHLPKLERLVLQNCNDLEKIPGDFADIATLEIIEVRWCGQSVEESAKRISQEAKEMSQEIKVVISSSNWRSSA